MNRNIKQAKFIFCALFAACTAQIATAGDEETQSKEQQQYLRVVEEKGKSVSLEIATHDFVHDDASKPRIGLVGVAHIADQSFYDSVAKLLEEYDVVLFESVKPPGTGSSRGETDEDRIESTRAAMKLVNSTIRMHYRETGEYPLTIDALEKFVKEHDGRMLQFLRTAMVDAWGNSLVYQHISVHDAAEDRATTSYTLISHGSDGKPGGEAAASDIQLERSTQESSPLTQDDGLQGQLASALGLEFQLTSLPYDSENWRCSDMAMDEVSRSLASRGLEFDALGGTLAGTSLPAQVIKLLLGFMKMADSMMDGAISDMVKIVLIEVLGEPKLMEQGLAQLGKGFGEVIINERNQVVVDDLEKIIENEPQVKSVAVLYGAGHMPDLVERLHKQLGYQDRAANSQWISAIKVDLTQSKMSAADIQRIRMMMRQALRQQMRRR